MCIGSFCFTPSRSLTPFAHHWSCFIRWRRHSAMLFFVGLLNAKRGKKRNFPGGISKLSIAGVGSLYKRWISIFMRLTLQIFVIATGETHFIKLSQPQMLSRKFPSLNFPTFHWHLHQAASYRHQWHHIYYFHMIHSLNCYHYHNRRPGY